MKSLFLPILFIAIFHSFQSIAQNVPTVIRVHESVGDTITDDERKQFGLFPNAAVSEYDYIVCLVDDGEMILRFYRQDLSYSEVQYNMQALMEDRDRVAQNQFTVIDIPQSGFKKAIINITSLDSYKTLKLKKRRNIELSLKGSNQTFRSKIKRIETSGQPAIFIRMENGTNKLIKISDIEYFNRYRTFEFKSLKWAGGMYAFIGVAGLIADAKENYKIALPFLAVGSIPFFFKNEKIYINNSKIKVDYK